MKTRFAFYLLSILLSSDAFSQNFLDGFYITLSGDTIRSQIRLKQSTITPSEFYVKVNKQEVVFNVNNSLGFGINNGEYFVKRKVQFHTNNITYNNAPDEFSDEIVVKEIFLKIVERGVLNLYELRLRERYYYFIEEEGTGPVELLYRMKSASGKMTEDVSYQSQLVVAINKYNLESKFITLANKLKYTSNDLGSFVKLVNKRNNKSTYSLKKQKIEFGVTFGLNHVFFPSTFNGEVFTPSFSFSSEGITKPIGGFTFNYPFIRTNGRVQLGLSALFTSFAFNETRSDTVSNSQYISIKTQQYYMKQNRILLAIHSVVILNPNAKTSLFVKPGVVAGFAINRSNLYGSAMRLDYKIGETTPYHVLTNNTFTYDKPFTIHFAVGSGFEINRNVFELNYTLPVNITKNGNVKPLKTGYLFLTYTYKIIK